MAVLRETEAKSARQAIRVGATLFMLALALRLAVVTICASNVSLPGLSYVFRPLVISGGDASDYDTMAENLLAGRGLVEKEGAATRQPLFPLMLAGIYALFGRSALALAIVQAILGAITAVVCWLLVREYYSPATAFTAGLIVALGFQSLRLMVRVRQEPLMTFLVVSAVLAHAYAGRTCKHRHAALAGALVGLAYLCRTPFLLFSVFGAWWLYWRWSVKGAASLRRLGAYALGLALVMTPWLIRNRVMTGHSSPLTSRASAFLWCANAPPAKTVWEDPPHGDHEGLGRKDRAYSAFIRRLARERRWSPSETWDYRIARAKAYLAAHPQRYLELALSRFLVLWQLWPTPPPPVPVFVGLWFVYAVALIGGWAAWRAFPESRLFVAVILTFTIVHVATHGISRYKAPAMPFVWLLFAYGTHYVLAWYRRKIGPSASRAVAGDTTGVA